jgi:iron complex transport system substrate-binding protein
MDLLDGDVIFAMLDPRSEESFQQFQNHPLWQTLNAVKTNQVYQVDSGYWSFGNLLAANAILDDLFRYLLPTDQP